MNTFMCSNAVPAFLAESSETCDLKIHINISLVAYIILIFIMILTGTDFYRDINV